MARNDSIARNGFIARSVAALGLGTALLAPLPAHALEADAFGTALKDLLASQQLIMDYESAALDGDTVTLSGVTLGIELPESDDGDTPSEMAMNVPELVFEGVTEREDGGYEAVSMIREAVSAEFTDVDDDGTDIAYSIGRWGIEGITVPGEGATGAAATYAASGLFYDRLFVEDATLDMNGERYVTLAAAEATTDVDVSPTTFAVTMDDLATDLTVPAAEDETLADWIEGTGYETLTIDYDSSGTWDLETGALNADVNTIALEGMGQFDLTIGIGGYTAAFVEALGRATEQMGGDEQAQQAGGMQLLGLLAQLSFGEFTMSYRDGGMADNLLTYYAETEGKTKEELIVETTAVLPIALGQLQVPELQAQITDAVTSFLNDPQSITVSLKPDAPVPAPVLMGAAATSPAQLAQALNAQVRANELGTME